MSIGRRRARHVLGWGLATGLLLTVVPIVPQAAQAAGSITASRDANAVTSALTMTSGVVTSAAFDAIPPAGNPAAVSTQPLTAFPSDSSSYAILSTGDATQAGVNDQSQFTSVSDGGGNLRGNTDYDATVLKIGLNVPSTANCLQFDFQFLSEEFPEFKGSAYNDAFIAELDTSNWTTSGSNITAPNNFALDDSNPPSEVSVNSLGDTRVTAGQAFGPPPAPGRSTMAQRSHSWRASPSHQVCTTSTCPSSTRETRSTTPRCSSMDSGSVTRGRAAAGAGHGGRSATLR